jgi:hypothetical protein
VGQSCIDFVAKFVPRFWNDLSTVYGWICPWILRRIVNFVVGFVARFVMFLRFVK